MFGSLVTFSNNGGPQNQNANDSLKNAKQDSILSPKQDSISKKDSTLIAQQSSSNNDYNNSESKIFLFLWLVAGGLLVIIIIISLMLYKLVNNQIDELYRKINHLESKINRNSSDFKSDSTNDIIIIKRELKTLSEKIDNNKTESKVIKTESKSDSSQVQRKPMSKLLYAESPDDLVFSKFGKEPTGVFLYTIDTSKNTFTIDKTIQNVVLKSIAKFSHACIIEGNMSSFSRYEIIEGKVKELEENTWDITQKIKLKLY